MVVEWEYESERERSNEGMRKVSNVSFKTKEEREKNGFWNDLAFPSFNL